MIDMFNNKKNFSIFLTLGLIILIIGINYYFLTNGYPKWKNNPNQQISQINNIDTINLNVYTNEDYGFEFKYPLVPTGCESCKINENSGGLIMSTVDLTIKDSGGLGFSDFIDKQIEDFIVGTKKEKLIGGKKGISVDYRFGGTSRFGSAVFVEGENNKIIIFSFSSGVFCCKPGADNIYESDFFDTMLSTFKFID
jgi:hypothetical protein